MEHAMKRKLSKKERKAGRGIAVKKAITEANRVEIFVTKKEFDKQKSKSIRELADEMYRKDYG